MALRPYLIDKLSPFLGEACALCKEPFAPGEAIVICPDDATRHHLHCWRANQNRCTAFGCQGAGEVEEASPPPRDGRRPRIIDQEETHQRGRERPAPRIETLPSSSFGCAQGCLIIAIAAAIVISSIGCFGLWAIADYIMLEILGWPYRDSGATLLPALTRQLLFWHTTLTL